VTGIATSRRLGADLILVFVSFLWGVTFVIVKSALADASALVFLALRFTLATLLLASLFRHRPGTLNGFLAEWRGGAVCGGFLFLGYALQTMGLLSTSASKSAFLTGLYIVIVPILSSALHWRAPGWIEWAGTALSIGGTALLTNAASTGFRLSLGDLLTIGCAFAFSAHMVAVAHFSTARNHEALTLWQILSVAVLAAAGCGWIETPRLVWTPRLVFALVVTAVFATAVCFALYTWAQARTSATHAALIFALEPVFAALMARIWSGESWTLHTLSGAALILAAILFVELKPSFGQTHPQSQAGA
jgi:drug/metabolite transporter (DMT)-like permease